MTAGGQVASDRGNAARTGTGGVAASRPGVDGRTRSIWLTQLVLAGSILGVTLAVLAMAPTLFTRGTFVGGVAAIIVLTLITLGVPWARLPRRAVLSIVYADLLAIGVLALGTDLRFSFLWVFPVTWLAMHFSALDLGVGLALIAGILLLEGWFFPSLGGPLKFLVVIIALGFIGITMNLAMRQTRAFKMLLRRQAARLEATIGRVSDQERRTTEIVNGIDSGIARFSDGGELLAINDACARLFGMDPHDPTLQVRAIEYTELRGAPVRTANRLFTRAARGDVFENERVWLFDEQGEWHALSATAKRLSSDDDGAWNTLLIVHDITTVIEAQRTRDQFTAFASHELRNPLTVVLAQTELGLEIDEPAPRLQRRLETIQNATERMLTMVADLLSDSKSAFQQPAERTPIRIEQIVAASVESFAASAASRGVSLRVDITAPGPALGDAFRLRQVFDNLISNAIKYTLRDGSVTVRVERGGQDAVVTVSDSGIGIGKEDLAHIFDPYFRTEVAKETSGGTGLGMGIVKSIVDWHDGEIHVTSTEGTGTSVIVLLPLEIGAEQTPSVSGAGSVTVVDGEGHEAAAPLMIATTAGEDADG